MDLTSGIHLSEDEFDLSKDAKGHRIYIFIVALLAVVEYAVAEIVTLHLGCKIVALAQRISHTIQNSLSRNSNQVVPRPLEPSVGFLPGSQHVMINNIPASAETPFTRIKKLVKGIGFYAGSLILIACVSMILGVNKILLFVIKTGEAIESYVYFLT